MSEFELDRLESLWNTFQNRRSEDPQLSIAKFAEENATLADEINNLFPLMSELSEYAKDPIGHPEQIGPYHIERQIGIGGMGVVYEATGGALEQTVALKVVDVEGMNPRQRDRLAREARLTAKLHHNHIVPVYDFGVEGSLQYFAMRLIPGPNLAEVLQHDFVSAETLDDDERRIVAIADELAGNWDLQIELIRQASSAIAYAHDERVLHRDIKPANLLLDPKRKLWVTDFGLARSGMGDMNQTGRSRVLGTPRYMAPEQIRGESDERSDVFGLGLTLYEMVLLRALGDNSRQSIWRGGLQSPRHWNPEVPEPLAQLIMKSVSLEQSQRHASVLEFIEDLDRVRAQLSASDPPAVSAVPLGDEPHTQTGSSDEFDLQAIKLPFNEHVTVPLDVDISDEREINDWSSSGDLRQDTKGPPLKRILFPFAATLLVAVLGVSAYRSGAMGRSRAGQNPNRVSTDAEDQRSSAMMSSSPTNTDTQAIASADEPEGMKRILASNQPAYLAKSNFQADGRTILIARENADYPIAMKIVDDDPSNANSYHVRIVGGRDAKRFGVTVDGVLAPLQRPRVSETSMVSYSVDTVPPRPSESKNYELSLSITDRCTPFVLQIHSDDEDRFNVVRSPMTSQLPWTFETLAADVSLPANLVDIAANSDSGFYHLHRDDAGSASLFFSEIGGNSQLQSQLINSDCGLPQQTIAIAMTGPKQFLAMVVDDTSQKTARLRRCTLEDGEFESSELLEDCLDGVNVVALSGLSSNQLHWIDESGSDSGSTIPNQRFAHTFIGQRRLIGMPVDQASSHFDRLVRGHASYIQTAPDSATTIREITLRYE